MKGRSASLAQLPIKGTAHRPEYGEDDMAPQSEAPDGVTRMVAAPPPKPGTVNLNLRLPPEVQQQLNVLKFRTGRSINKIIVEAVELYLKELR